MPAGLADGLALKEQRYVRQRRTIRPDNLGPRFPDFHAGIRLGCGQASTLQIARAALHNGAQRALYRKLRAFALVAVQPRAGAARSGAFARVIEAARSRASG
jgi:hypothetical protein